jgi:hypothetical protein
MSSNKRNQPPQDPLDEFEFGEHAAEALLEAEERGQLDAALEGLEPETLRRAIETLMVDHDALSWPGADGLRAVLRALLDGEEGP